MKKPFALAAAAVLAACLCFGCSASPEEASPSPSASGEASAAEEASAAASATVTDLDTEHTIEGLSYKVSSAWAETDAGTMAAYSAEAAPDLPFTITVAAMDPELVLSAEASDEEPNGALLGLLGVETSGVQPSEFDGRSAFTFSGEVENGYQATGYTVRQDDATEFVLMLQSTNTSDIDVQQIWQGFLDTVKLPE